MDAELPNKRHDSEKVTASFASAETIAVSADPVLPPVLVSSLRQLLLESGSHDQPDDGSSAAVLQDLLESISTHPIVPSAQEGDSGERRSGTPPPPGAAKLEAIVGNAIGVATAPDPFGSRQTESFRALIIAALSIVTSTLPVPEGAGATSTRTDGAEDVIVTEAAAGREVEASIATPDERTPVDQATVQVGGALSLPSAMHVA